MCTDTRNGSYFAEIRIPGPVEPPGPPDTPADNEVGETKADDGGPAPSAAPAILAAGRHTRGIQKESEGFLDSMDSSCRG